MRRVALLATVLATLLALAGCGSEEPAEPPAGSADRVELDLTGGEAPPVERVEMRPGEEVELVITADEPGQLHVHTDPVEETIDYSDGTTTVTLSVDQPGVVDVELHDPAQLVLQLEVG